MRTPFAWDDVHKQILEGFGGVESSVLEAIAIRLEGHIRLEAIAIRLDPIAIRLDPIAIGSEAIAISLDPIAIR